ncbi:cation transporter [Paenibacillus cisolokensis]|uniref:cation transporter n=1 Tax=Paenibacillus cisolokensis TaxID=1658519 RepID=UPI0035590E9D
MCKMKQRYARSEAAIRYGLWGNTALALFKGIVGWLSGSTALLADAFRSTAEAAESYADLRLSRRARAGRAVRGGDMKAETAKTSCCRRSCCLPGWKSASRRFAL